VTETIIRAVVQYWVDCLGSSRKAASKPRWPSRRIPARLVCLFVTSLVLPSIVSGMNDQDGVQQAYARAVEHFQDGRIEAAEQELSEVIRSAPQLPEPYFLLGKVYQLKQQPAKAEEMLRQAVSLKPDFAEAYHSLGVALLAQNKNADAAEAFLTTVRLQPQYAPAHINLASAYLGLNKAKEAEAEFQKALELAPEDRATAFVTNFNLGLLYYRRGEYPSALTRLVAASALDEQNVGVLLPLCDTYFKLHRLADASPLVQRLSQLAEKSPDLRLRLGLLLVENERYEEAHAQLAQARQLLPTSFELLQGLGSAEYHLGRFAEAEPDLLHALALKPRPQTYGLLGEVYLAQNDARAIEALEKCVTLDPADDKGWEELSRELARRKEYDHAVEIFKQRVEQNPQNLLARLLLGEAYFNKSSYADALEQFHKALELEHNVARTYYSLGLVYKTMGTTEEAKANFQQALRLNPESALTDYNLGDLLLAEKNYPQATLFLTQAIKLNPDEAEFHFKLGQLYWLQKRYEVAADELQKAVQLRPDLAEAHYLLGRCYAALNRPGLAGAEYAKSRALRSATAHPTNAASNAPR
jgi:tetratricopeptide (TPR) repeat protein